MGFSYFKPKKPSRPQYTFEIPQNLEHINLEKVSWREIEETGVLTRDTLIRSLQRNAAIYDDIEVKKRDGTSRHISVPHKSLRIFQYQFLKNNLDKAEYFHPAAFAYIKGKSAVQCARLHQDATWLIKIDIKDFFHYIDERMIYWALRERKVDDYKAFFFARMMTREAWDFESIYKELPSKYRKNRKHKLSKKFGKVSQRLGFLPQGSPSSGALANLVCFTLDNRLSDVAVGNNLTYTRYADDIVFSSTEPFERQAAENALAEAQKVIRRFGFHTNPAKTRIIPPGARKQILGVLVGEGRLRLPKASRNRVDGDIRGIAKFGFKKHGKFKGDANELALLNRVFGSLVWAHEVDASWAEPRMELLSNLANTQLAELFRKLEAKKK